LKWKIVGDFPRDLNKYVIIAVPHTHWQDFPMGLMLRSILDIKINFVAKKELFKPILGWYLRTVGGTAIDRAGTQNKVEAIAAIFDQYKEFRLAIAPEGTRKKVTEWKTGFYYIAKKANVPIVMVTFDFGKKQHKISAPFYTTANKEEDFKFMYSFFNGVTGRVSEYS
jgi:1-acyl-sn-glycerol-3-phosphate acyltransferase